MKNAMWSRKNEGGIKTLPQANFFSLSVLHSAGGIIRELWGIMVALIQKRKLSEIQTHTCIRTYAIGQVW